MSNLLIAIKSCKRDFDLGCHNAIRETWGKDAKALGIDVRFFIGRDRDDTRSNPNLRSDETALGVADDYMSLSLKTREICAWTTSKIYQHIYFADNDTFIIPRKLAASGYQNYDYQGYFHKYDPLGPPFEYESEDPKGVKYQHPICYAWASGGVGYFLSRAAALAVADTYPKKEEWAEDLYVGQVVGRGAALGEFRIKAEPRNDYAFHYPTPLGYKLEKKWMETMYGEHK